MKKSNLTSLLERVTTLSASKNLKMCDLIDGERVSLGPRIGGGHCGDVYLGELSEPSQVSRICQANPFLKESQRHGKCAIKKEKRETQCSQITKPHKDEELRNIIIEAALCQQLNHDNIVKFYGMVLAVEDNETLVAMELMDCDLEGLLHKKKYNIPFETKMKILIDTAKGHEFVAQQGFVHRDIACRNILVSLKNPGAVVAPENITCKITDFGISLKMNKRHGDELFAEIDPEPESETPMSLWAPESLKEHSEDGLKTYFTEYSDVFNFGMLIWEVCQIDTCSGTDSKSCQNCKTKTWMDLDDYILPRGEKMPIPSWLDINQSYQDLKKRMLTCWKYKPQKKTHGPHQKTRGGFKILRTDLERIQMSYSNPFSTTTIQYLNNLPSITPTALTSSIRDRLRTS